MKIALVIDKFTPHGGGAEAWTDGHARNLLERGHEVHLVSRHVEQPPAGAICHVLENCPRGIGGRRLGLPGRAAQLLQTISFDLVHDMGVGWHADIFMPHHGTRRAVYNQRTKLLYPPERWLRPMGYHCLPRYLRFKALERRQYTAAPRKIFVAVSKMVRDQMIRFYGVPSNRIRVIYNGVDTKQFAPLASDAGYRARRALRENLGFTDETVFLLVSHDFDLKGLATILRSICALLRDGRRVGLIVVGPGTMKGKKIWGIPVGRALERYRRLARQWGCDAAVRFVGLQRDPVPYYHAADAYVQPTLYDACSLVVLEAMACGLPIITSRQNGVSELIEDGVEGLLVNNPQIIHMVTARMEALLDSNRRRVIGEQARRLTEQHTAQDNFRQIMDVYQQSVRARADRNPTRVDQQPTTVCATVTSR